MKDFVHLHLHTEYSLLDGAARIKKVVEVAKSYGMKSLAITDHGNMYGVIKFHDECKKQGVKPIIGCEMYIAGDLKEKNPNNKYSHLILLVKNEQGFKNLSKLNSIAFVEGFYYKPRIDFETLKKYSEGLICTSACLGGDIPQAILNRDYEEAKRLIKWFKDVFGDDFYLELQNHGLAEQVEVNEKLREYAKEFNIKKVATNDVHYIFKEDAEVQDVLMCIQMGKTLDDPNRMKFSSDEFYLKTQAEMAAAFPGDADALANTAEIAQKCNFSFEYGHYLYPAYKVPEGKTTEGYLREIVHDGLIERFGEITPQMTERVEKEIAVVGKQGYIEYYLIVWDYIKKAREMGISVGPGRGSGAGSILAYAMGITNIDPLRYNLLFERFLHSERVSAPDFDIDFEDARRDEVIEYVKEKYGEDRVIKIVTFGTMAGKMAIKDVARVLKMPYSQSDKITKSMPNSYTKPYVIRKAFGMYKPKEGASDYGTIYGVPELIEMYNSSIDVKKVVDIAIKLEDMPRQVSTHPCGVVIGADRLDNHIPLSRNGDDITTQFNMIEIEQLGHLKMDFLGLRNLTDIQSAINMVKENYGVEIDFDNMEYDDPEVFKLISTGNTKGIFQIESSGFQKFMKELQPTNIEDITAGVSLYRPGPMDSIPRYVHNKHNPSDVVYDHPVLEPILNVTYGCIVYQEQVMQIVQDMAGYTLGQADMVRRMMGKKDIVGMAKEKDVFIHGRPNSEGKSAIEGAVARGVSEAVAEKVWGEMADFAKYAFNKSHAAAYSYITYQTAYLKRYYEAELLTSILNNRITNADEITNYVTHAKEEGLAVLPPDINKSFTMFTVKDKQIRFGLAALKGVGVAVVEQIINERKLGGDFTSFENFINRLDNSVLNKRTLESLILSGAFDAFGNHRSQLMRVYPQLLERASFDRKTRASGQFSMFDTILKDDAINSVVYPNIPEFNEQTKLKFEKEVVGVYVTGHPLSNYSHIIGNYSLTSDMINFVPEQTDAMILEEDELVHDWGLTDGQEVTCGGIIAEVKKLFTKRDNKEMAFVRVEDLYGSLEVVFYSAAFAKFKHLLNEDALVHLWGKVSLREGHKPSVIVNKVELWNSVEENNVQQAPKTLYLKFDITNEKLLSDISNILKAYPGKSQVKCFCTKQKATFLMPYEIDEKSFVVNELHAFLPNENIVLK